MVKINLVERMLKKSGEDNLPEDHVLVIAANKFDEAIRGFFGNPQTCNIKEFMRCWARARRSWCDYTGENLI